MAEFLSADLKATLEWVLTYVSGNIEKPLDEKVVDELSKHHVELGYDSELKLREDFRDKPASVFIQAILTLNDNA